MRGTLGVCFQRATTTGKVSIAQAAARAAQEGTRGSDDSQLQGSAANWKEQEP